MYEIFARLEILRSSTKPHRNCLYITEKIFIGQKFLLASHANLPISLFYSNHKGCYSSVLNKPSTFMSSLSTLILYSDLCLSFKCLHLSLKKKLHTCIYFPLQPFLCLLALEFSFLTAKSYEGLIYTHTISPLPPDLYNPQLAAQSHHSFVCFPPAFNFKTLHIANSYMIIYSKHCDQEIY